MVGVGTYFPIMGPGDALLHELPGLPNLQRSAPRLAVSGMAQPGRVPDGSGQTAHVRCALRVETLGAGGGSHGLGRVRSSGTPHAQTAISDSWIGIYAGAAGMAL